MNPAHEDFGRIRLVRRESIRWDERLFDAPTR
jgi:hypothetical protein